jgi:hypothetical protein
MAIAQTSPPQHLPDLVTTCRTVNKKSLLTLLARYGLQLCWADPPYPIPGSFWGDDEAGLIGNSVWVNQATPVHSVLHEMCHYVCMDASRRASLHTNAGGDDTEEAAVCYLQVVLTDYLPDIGQTRLFADMDAWGYSFRLGSTRAWFENDADDARNWLQHHGLMDNADRPSWRLRH